MTRTAASLSFAVAAALAACPPAEDEDDKDDEPHPLTGVYTVTTHTEAEPCEAAPAAPDFPITRFKLSDAEFFFADILGFFDCSETLDPTLEELDADGCSTSASLQYSGMEPDDSVQITSCGCSEETCGVSGTSGGWKETADGAELLLRRLGGDVPNPDAPSTECDPPVLFEANKDALTCELLTTISGTLE